MFTSSQDVGCACVGCAPPDISYTGPYASTTPPPSQDLNTHTSQPVQKSYPLWVFSQGPCASSLCWHRSQPQLEYSFLHLEIQLIHGLRTNRCSTSIRRQREMSKQLAGSGVLCALTLIPLKCCCESQPCWN